MVAIVSGSSLGLDLTSWRTLGERVASGSITQGRGGETVAVNVANGNLVLQTSDQMLFGRGPDGQLLRTYNSQGLRDDDNGDNWRQSVAPRPLQLVGTWGATGSTVRRTGVDGSVAVHQWDVASGTYVCTDGDGAHDSVRRLSDGRLEWRDGSSGVTQVHAGTADGCLLESRDASGNVLTFTYDTQGRLDRMSTPGGDAMTYQWSGNNLLSVTTLRSDGTTADITRYTYDGNNRLSRVTVDLTPGDGSVADGKVYTTTYTYDTSNRIVGITQSDGTTLTLGYVSFGGRDRIASIRDALGQVTSFSYAVSDGVAGYATVTDPTGLVTRYDVDAKGQLTGISAPAVGGRRPATTFTWDDSGNLLTRTDGEGRVTTCEYDTAGNQQLVRDSLGNTVTRTFNGVNQMVCETRYLAPDPDGAGTQLPGSPLNRWLVYDDATGMRLLFAVEPDGSVTEHRYNQFGERYATLQYTSRAAVPTGLPTQAQMTAWAATQPVANVIRTDFSYDARGQLARSVQWAQLGSDGQGVADGLESVQRYIRDAAGRVLQIVDSGTGTTSFTYDGLGRELSRTDAYGITTATEFADAVRTTRTRLNSGLVTTSVWDAAGRLLSTSDSSAAGVGLGETRNWYDAAGRLRMTQDPAGTRRWLFWDAAGRQAAEIDARGGCTFYTYDASDRVTEVRRSAGVANVAALVDGSGQPQMDVTLTSVAPAATDADTRELRVYDMAGRLWRTARSFGSGTTFSVTEQRFDGLGRVVATVAYASSVSIAAGGTVVPTPATSGGDRLTRQFWDSAGRLVGRLNAEGALVTWSWDAAGRCLEERAWAIAAAASLRASGTLAQLQPAVSAADQRTLRWYDAAGRVLAELDAEGFLTETVYDAAGRVTQSVRYATPSPATNVTATTPRTQLRPAPSAQDRTTSRTWDLSGRLLSETTDGITTTWAYDAQGRVTSTLRAAGTEEARSLLARYDMQGRLVGELAGEGAAQLTGTQTQDQVDAIWARWGIRHTYDAAGRRLSTADPAQGLRWFYYDAAGALTHVINALGEVTGNRYDSMGRLIERQAWSTRIATTNLTGGVMPQAVLTALGTPVIVERLSYDRAGDVLTRTDGNNVVTGLERNAFGEITRQMTPTSLGVIVATALARDRMGRVISESTGQSGATALAVRATQYDVFGRVIRTTDPAGAQQTLSWDRLGRLVQQRDPTGGVRSTTYDAFGQAVLATDAMGAVTRYAWDTTTRTQTVTTAEGIVTASTRNRFGQVVRLVDGAGQATTWRYDRSGRLLQTVAPEGTGGSSEYDEGGREIATVDANGVRTVYSYDATGRMLTRTLDPEGLGLQTTWTWDARGRRIDQRDASGLLTTWQYDAMDRVLRQTVDPGGLNLQTLWSYDNQGRVLTVTDPGLVVTTTSFDLLGRRVSERVGPPELGISRTWTWDAAGHLLSATDPTGATTRFVNDAAGQAVYTVDATGHVQRTVRDLAGRVVRTISYAQAIKPAALPAVPTMEDVQAQLVEQPGSDQVEHRVLDRDGRLVAVVDGTGGVVRFTLDAMGRVVRRTAHANRIDLSLWVQGTIPQPVADPASDEQSSTVYDGAGRVQFTVDGAGGLVSFRWDGAGNLLERTAYARAIPQATALTALALSAAAKTVAEGTQDAVERHVYDAAGRRTWSADGTGAVTQRLFDGAGRVVRTVRFANTVAAAATPSSVLRSNGDAISVRAYDAAGRLVLDVDPAGAVVELSLNGNGQVTRRTAYAALAPAILALPVPTLAAVRAACVADSSTARVTWQSFDAGGRKTVDVDATGAVTEFTYDGLGREVRRLARARTIATANLGKEPSAEQIRRLVVTSPGDRLSRRFFDGSGQLAAEIDAAGAVRTFRYDGIGRLLGSTAFALSITDPAIASLDQVVLTVRSNPADRTEIRTWNAAGHLVALTDALGQTERYTRDAIGRQVAFTNKLNATWTYAFDAAGRQISETTPVVRVVRAVLDSAGNLRSDSTFDAAITTRQTWDALGRLTQRTEASGTAQQRVTSYAYDAAGRQIRVVLPPLMVYDVVRDSVSGNGFGATPQRFEMAKVPEIRTVYDAFGQAIASSDVGGAIACKAYDAQGRVVYEIDPLGRITKYERNAFGEVTALTRFGQALSSLVPTSLTPNGGLPSRAVIDTALAAPSVNHAADRTITTRFDLAGRATTVVEPVAHVDQAGATPTGRTTETRYDAFGQAIEVKLLRTATSTQTWSVTTRYWDALGRERATVDALGYLTTRAFDAAGNLTQTTEFATALSTDSWSVDGFQTPVTSLDDRTTLQSWDKLNRRVSQTRVGVEYSTDATGTSQRGDAQTFWSYDALGNISAVTDAEGGITRTAYDALGRVQAIAAPARPDPDGVVFSPVTSFGRDVYGNVTVRTEHSGRGVATADSITLPAAAAGDRVTRFSHDVHGHEFQSTDANGDSTFRSYDAWGHVAKRWQPVKDVDGRIRTLYQRDDYDMAGQLVSTRTPGLDLSGTTAPAPVITQTRWNAFGEMTFRQTGAELAETFEWDNAGHLWRTNSGDGVTRIQLFDVQGNVTTELRSAGSTTDLKSFTSAAAASAAASALRRTTYERDALGRVVKQYQPERAQSKGDVQVRSVTVKASILQSAENSYLETADPSQAGKNRIRVDWSGLSSLGPGDVRVEVQYVSFRIYTNLDTRTAYDGEIRTRTSPATVTEVASGGLEIGWTDPPNGDLGVARILCVRVYKRDLKAESQLVYDSSAAFGSMGLELTTPADAKDAPVLELRRAGSVGTTGWFTVDAASLVDFGDVRRFDTSVLGAGSWEYRASVPWPGGAPVSIGSGTFTVAPKVLGGIAADVGVNRMGTDIGILSWNSPGGAKSQTFRYRAAGSTAAWSTLDIASWGPSGRDGVEIRRVPGGTYDYELLWGDAGSADMSAHVTGQFTVNAAQAPRYIPPPYLPPFERVECGVGFNGRRMVPALNLYTGEVPSAQIRPVGGAWTALLVTGPTFNMGDLFAPNNQVLMPDTLAAGTYEIRLMGAGPTQSTARYTVPPAVPGYWTTESYSDYVEVEIGRDEYNNPIMQGQWVTKTRSVWVPGYQPDPTLTLTTPPYIPGYWTAAIPASYSVTIGAGAGTSAISTAVSSITTGARTAGDDRRVRPVIQQSLDRWGNLLAITDARASGWTTRYTYNASNQVTSTTMPDSAGAQSAGSPVRRWYFDRMGRQLAARDALGNVNGQRWDAAGQLVEEIHADTGVIRHTYDALGNRVRTLDAEGWTTAFQYDAVGRKLKVLNQGMSKSGALSTTWAWTYDAAGRMLTQTNGANERTSYVWDLRGNLAQTRQPLGQTLTTLWDAFGRKSRETDANGAVATWTYDAFGRVQLHTDLGGRTTRYSYDLAGQLVSQTSDWGQDLTYSYDAAGQLTGIVDKANGKTTSYQYDLSGRRVREKTVQRDAATLKDVVYQDNHLAWDSRGLLRSVSDGRAQVQMDYDLEGNRTHVFTRVTYQGLKDPVTTDTHRYNRYNVMNRQIRVDAETESGALGGQFHLLSYDLNGNRKSDMSWGTHVVPSQSQVIVGWDETGKAIYTSLPVTYTSSPGWVTETYAYDGQNRMFSVVRDGVQIDHRLYDGAGRVVRQGPDGQPQAYMDALNAGLPPGQTNGQEIRTYGYDGNGRLFVQRVQDAQGAWRSETVWDAAYAAQAGITANGSIGYDAAGNVLGSVVRTYPQGEAPMYVNTYTNAIERREGYLQTGTTATSTWQRGGSTAQTYDANGYLVGFTDSNQPDNNRSFVNDAEGRALWVNQAGRVQRQLVANGEVLGTYGIGVDAKDPSSGDDRKPNFVEGQDFGFGYARVSASYPSAAPGNYSVRSGDTLQTIARGAYGDSRQWFRIAEANGLSGPADVKVGQTLRIPSLPGGSSNDATTFRTYDPSRMAGDMSPTLLAPLPGGCGSTGKLLMVVVAVAVFAITAQAEFISSFWSTLLGSPASGIAVKAAVAATAAVASNVASQVVGMATGDVQRFDWRSVAISAVGGAISGGLEAGMFGNAFAGPALPNAIARAALTNAMTQGVAVITGAQQKFDWRGVAAAAVSTAIAGDMRNGMGGGDGGGGALKLTAVGLVAGLAAAAVRGGRVSMQQVGVDAFGNALGSSLASASNGSSYQGEGTQARPYVDSNGDHIVLGTAPKYNWVTVEGMNTRTFNPTPSDKSEDVLYAGSPVRSPADMHWYESVRWGAPASGRNLREVVVTARSLGPEDLVNGPGDLGVAPALSWKASAGGSIALPGTGEIKAIAPSLWESTWGSLEVQRVMGNTVTGKILGGIVNFIGTGVSAFRNDGYNPATLKYVHGVNRRRALQDTVIGLPAMLVGGGPAPSIARAELNAAAQAELRLAAQAGRVPERGVPNALLPDSELLTNRPTGINDLALMERSSPVVTSLRHAAWGSDLGEVSATIERLGVRALRQSKGNASLSEQLFETYLNGVDNRLGRVGSEFGVEIQPAAIAGGERVPNFIYLHRGGPSSPLIKGRDGLPKLYAYPESRRLDAGVFSGAAEANEYGLRPIAAGFDITTSRSKPNIVRYYQEFFGNVPIYDIRLPR